ncbi:hypothetical protein LzC2_37210 [Planctomycetes bacterium LzC2]|uniref:Uncharacterized protein n=1 Tax=Alienimonas chondri TaxID=2681879 RepID=A0ABX1VHN1_9PLAN|nr:hypothetical protein [Alienimonas chondri]
MQTGAEDGPAAVRGVPHGPPGQRPGRLLDVVFRVAPRPQGEEFEELSSEVFVGSARSVLIPVQPQQHRRIGHHRRQQIAEPAESETSKHRQLLRHQAGVRHLGSADGEVAVPEQGHFLPQNVRRSQHAVHPGRGESVEPAAVTGRGLHLRRRGIETPDFSRIRLQQILQRRPMPPLGHRFQLPRDRPEPGASQQMRSRGPIPAHVRRGPPLPPRGGRSEAIQRVLRRPFGVIHRSLAAGVNCISRLRPLSSTAVVTVIGPRLLSALAAAS